MPVKIIAKKDGFRRAGLAHFGTQVYPDDHFTEAQLEALGNEPNLDLSYVGADPTDGVDIGEALKEKPEARKGKK